MAFVTTPYTTSGPEQLMDIYTPKGAAGALPAVVYIHGGGWAAGSRSHQDGPADHFTKQGYVFCSIDYRFSDVAKYPAQIQDSKCAIRFLRANAAKYRIDPKRIGVWGDSAGGHLVALLGLTPKVKRLEGDGGWQKQSSAVAAVVDWYGPSDIRPEGLGVYTNPAGIDLITRLLGDPNNAKLAADASPITFVTKDAAPMLIMHGDKDSLVPVSQSQKLYDALHAAGADVTLKILPGAEHGGPQFVEPENVALIDAFFARMLKPGKK
jgi:acetyl esterase/lipase